MGMLHDTLMQQLDNLVDTTGDELDREIKRAAAMAKIGSVLIQNASLALEVEKLALGAGAEPSAPAVPSLTFRDAEADAEADARRDGW